MVHKRNKNLKKKMATGKHVSLRESTYFPLELSGAWKFDHILGKGKSH